MAGRDNRRWGLALAVAYGSAVGVLAATSERQPPPRTVEMPPQRRRRRPTVWVLSTLLAVGGLGGGLAAATTLGPEIGPGRAGVVALRGSGSGSSVAPLKTSHPAAETVRTEPSPTAPPEPPPPTAAEVAVATAREQIGKPYRWAATGPSAFDCSGLTSFAWRAAGVELPRTSRAQFGSLPRVPSDQLRPGDLVYSPGHIGMFIGDGQMIHAPLTGRNVEVAPLRQPMLGAVRPAPADMPAA